MLKAYRVILARSEACSVQNRGEAIRNALEGVCTVLASSRVVLTAQQFPGIVPVMPAGMVSVLEAGTWDICHNPSPPGVG